MTCFVCGRSLSTTASDQSVFGVCRTCDERAGVAVMRAKIVLLRCFLEDLADPTLPATDMALHRMQEKARRLLRETA